MKIEARSQRLYLALITALLVATLILAAGRLCASTIIPSFHYYGATMGGNINETLWNGFSDETKPAGVSAGTGGKASQWSAGIMSTNGSATNIFSGNNPNFGTDTTDFISSANSGGIYSFFSQTHYQIASSTPEAGMQSLILQIYMAEGLSGMFGGTPVSVAAAPMLSVVTAQGTQAFAASFFEQTYHDSAFVNGSNTYLDMLAYQWDLSSVVDPILSYSINWQSSYHGIIYGADVTESNHAAPGAILTVPEPSRALFSLLAFTGLALRRRRA